MRRSLPTSETRDIIPLSEVALTAEGHSPFVYYYMRVTQDNWDRGWSSPCWLELD